MARILQGKSHKWQLGDTPIGSGDAGEVYAVTCVEEPHIIGVMKKPAHIATGGTIQRQAGQIAQETLALTLLKGLPKCKAHPPRLLDVSQDFTQGTANYFMVSETAPGVDMANMLSSYRQKGKPFPRRVIITVLDALFDLFSRAHRAGVLWNDVKLDHIYWDRQSAQVAVIDWGNAQFLNGDGDKHRPAPPRWEDYQQLVASLGGFLKQYAPELYADLGWDEFQEKELDLPQVSILAHRISYQQQVIELRVMEYQALSRVILSAEPDLKGLQKILYYQKLLEEIGAPWDSKAILDYGKSLITHEIKENNTQYAIKATSMIWDLYNDQLDVTWNLLREYFRIPDLIAHQSLTKLVASTFKENWSATLWILTTIANELGYADWWDHLIPVLHQKATGSTTPRPYQVGRSLLAWLESRESSNTNESRRLLTILQNWHQKGQGFEENPFDYEFLEFIQNIQGFPRRLNAEIKTSFSLGKETIREVIKAWTLMAWDDIFKALQSVIAWDPDRWGILHLVAQIEDLQTWVEKLYNGPAPDSDPQKFIEQIMNDRPRIEKILGEPPWLKSLQNLMFLISNGQPINDVKERAIVWCPWVLEYKTIDQQAQRALKDENAIKEALNQLSEQFKHGKNIESELGRIRSVAPRYYPICQKIINHFKNLADLNANLEEIAVNCTPLPHNSLKEMCEVLQILLAWRKTLANRAFSKALQLLVESQYQDWYSLRHAKKVTEKWVDQITPLLQSISKQEHSKTFKSAENHYNMLTDIRNDSSELKALWQRIYSTGINSQMIEKITELTDKNRAVFLEWRQAYEHHTDRFETLLYYYHLDLIRNISNDLLRLSQHARQAKLSFSELSRAENAPLEAVMRVSEDLLDHLNQIEQIFIDDIHERAFPGWISEFQQITNARTKTESLELILKLSNDHPLYAWLVQSVLTM